jgi:hypothetical protein
LVIELGFVKSFYQRLYSNHRRDGNPEKDRRKNCQRQPSELCTESKGKSGDVISGSRAIIWRLEERRPVGWQEIKTLRLP